MTNQRRIAVLFGLVALVGLSAAALFSPYDDRYFSGLPGIEEDLITKTESRLATLGADSAIVVADGRDLSVTLPRGLPVGTTEDSLKRELLHTEGVRAVSLDVPDHTLPQDPSGDSAAAPDPVPTSSPLPTAEPAPDPTAEPAPDPTAAPAPDPTAEPAQDPTAEPTSLPDPDPVPTVLPDPDPVPSATPETDPAGIIESLDLTGVSFQSGTAVLDAGSSALLDDAAQALSGLEGVVVEVQGHTDSSGDPDVNLLLSQERAEAVISYLVERGVDATILTPKGYGASTPIADNGTEQGRAANRRVELLVVEGN